MRLSQSNQSSHMLYIFGQNLENFLVKTVKLGIALTLLVPIVLISHAHITPSDESSKVIVFQILVELTVIFYAALAVTFKGYLPKTSRLLWAVFLFFTVEIVASLFGLDFQRSLFGNIWRGDSIVLHLHLLAFLVVIVGMFQEKKEWLHLFKIWAIASGISSVTAILQQLGIIDLFNKEVVRVSGTLVNPGLFGNYIALSLFIILLLIFLEPAKKVKIFWYLLLVLNGWALISSQTRGAWAGTIVGLLVVFVLQSGSILPSRGALFNTPKKRIAFSIILIALVAGAIFFGAWYFQDKNDLASRMYDIASLNLDDLRRSIWQVAWEGFKERPVLGWGADSLSFLWAKNSDGVGYANNQYALFVDRTHNKMLEILVSMGVAGLLSYFSIFAFTLYYLFKSSWERNQEKKIIKSVIVGFLACYLVEHFFLFDSISTYVIFLLVLGFVHNNFAASKRVPEKEMRRISVKTIMAIVVVFLGMIFIAYHLNIKPALAGILLYKGITSSTPEAAFLKYEQVLSKKTIFEADYNMAVLTRLQKAVGPNVGIRDSAKEIAFDVFSHELPHAYSMMESQDQNVSGWYWVTADMYKSWYLFNKDTKNLLEAETILTKAINFNPKMPAFYELMAEVSILQGKDILGQEYANLFYAYLPQNSVAERKFYMLLARSYFEKDEFQKGLDSAQKFLNLDYQEKKQNENDIHELNGASFTDMAILQYYKTVGDLSGTQQMYQRAMEIYPEYKELFSIRLKSISK